MPLNIYKGRQDTPTRLHYPYILYQSIRISSITLKLFTMKAAFSLLTLLAAIPAALAAGYCTPGVEYCGTTLSTMGMYLLHPHLRVYAVQLLT